MNAASGKEKLKDIVIQTCNAVVLVRGGQVSRIEGPGVLRLQEGEESKVCVDLRPQSGGFEVEVQTKDLFPLTIRGGVGFRIESQAETDRFQDLADAVAGRFGGVISGDYAVYKYVIYRAIYEVEAGKDWIKKTLDASGDKVRRIIRNYNLKNIFSLDGTERDESIQTELSKKVMKAMQKDARRWGVTVYGVEINEIEMPEKTRRHWEATWWKRFEIVQAQDVYNSGEHVPGISSCLYKRLRATLLSCGPFASDSELRAVFVDARLSPWRNSLPQAGDPASRVNAAVNFMYNKHNDVQENALVLLLQVLSDHTDPGDDCHRLLVELVSELEG